MDSNYLAFIISLVLLLIKEFVPLSKNKSSTFKESIIGGKILVLLSIISLIYGSYDTILKEKSAQKKEQANALLLSQRWTFDTLRFRQLLDTSEVIIKNNLESIKSIHENLSMSENLLRSAEIQSRNIQENIELTNKLNYPLPNSIGFTFFFKYQLDKITDSSIIRYLDEHSIAKDSMVYTRTDGSEEKNMGGLYYFDYPKLNHEKIRMIDNIVLFLLGGEINFVLKKDPILKLNSNYFWKAGGDIKNSSDFFQGMDFVYEKFRKQITVKVHNKIVFETDQKRKKGITSLIDLENSFLFLTTISPYGANFNAENLRLYLGLVIGDREIYFENLIPILPTDDEFKLLKNYNISTFKDYPFFFQYNINGETLRGFYKSLKDRDLYKRRLSD